MPEAYRKRIETVQDVERVVGMDWFGGIYKEPKNFFANFAVEHEDFFDVFPEVRLDAAAKQAFFAQRTAAFCGVKLAERFGWKVGDKVTLLGTIYPADLEFTLVGFYTSAVDERTFYFRRDYMQEALGKPGKVGVFFVLARSQEATPRVIERIDSMFRNTDAETLSETERAFQAGFQTMMGNVQGLVLSIMSVVVFMILLVVGNCHGDEHPRTFARNCHHEVARIPERVPDRHPFERIALNLADGRHCWLFRGHSPVSRHRHDAPEPGISAAIPSRAFDTGAWFWCRSGSGHHQRRATRCSCGAINGLRWPAARRVIRLTIDD